MKFEIIEKNKEKFMDLLLLGDEQESMINKYLQRGTLLALYEEKDRNNITRRNTGRRIS